VTHTPMALEIDHPDLPNRVNFGEVWAEEPMPAHVREAGWIARPFFFSSKLSLMVQRQGRVKLDPRVQI
jgi:hypothetical protein